MRLILLMLAGLALVALSGCGPRDHIRPDYGHHARQFFTQQHIYQTPEQEPPRGLDSEEAAAIHKGYRKQMLGEEGAKDTAPSRVLLLEAPKEAKK